MDIKNNASERFNAISLVVFKDTMEENPEEHFGILFENGASFVFAVVGT